MRTRRPIMQMTHQAILTAPAMTSVPTTPMTTMVATIRLRTTTLTRTTAKTMTTMMTMTTAEQRSGRETARSDPASTQPMSRDDLANNDLQPPAGIRSRLANLVRRGVGAVRRASHRLRVRVVAGSVLLLVVAVATLVFATRQVLVNHANARIDALLDQEVAELRSLADGTDPETGQPFGPDVRRLFTIYLERNTPLDNEAMLTFVGGEPFLRSAQVVPYRLDTDQDLIRRWTSLEGPDRGRVTTPAGGVDYLAVPMLIDGRPEGAFVAAVFREPELADIDLVSRVAGMVGALVVLIGAGFAWRLSDRILTPVHGLIDTSRAIGETDLSRRIDVDGDDEVAELADTFNEMLDRLEAAFEAQRRFVDEASHELKTPITAIRGHLEVLGDDPEERGDTVELVLDEIDRMTRMVNDLLLLAKAERPDFLRPAPVVVAQLVRTVHAKATGLAERDWQLHTDTDATLTADRDRLTQALLQLAQNAVEHTGRGQTIRFAATQGTERVKLSVSDDGPGIHPSEHEAIFEPFHRGDGAGERTGNAGLGLPIVKAIAEAHGGHVEVDSAPGHGARFTLLLPTVGGSR